MGRSARHRTERAPSITTATARAAAPAGCILNSNLDTAHDASVQIRPVAGKVPTARQESDRASLPLGSFGKFFVPPSYKLVLDTSVVL
jgi:hypothetical protein